MDGWRRMGLDDDFRIRQVLPVCSGSVLLLGSLGLVFHSKKTCITVNAIHLYTFLKGGENRSISHYLIQHNLR